MIVPIEQLWLMMQEDKPTRKKTILILHYTFLLLFLSSLCVPLNLPPPLPYNMMVSPLPGNLVCDVVHTSIEPKQKKKKNL